MAVYADYEKYHTRLEDKNLKKYVPPFDMKAAGAYIFVDLNKEWVRCDEIKTGNTDICKTTDQASGRWMWIPENMDMENDDHCGAAVNCSAGCLRG